MWVAEWDEGDSAIYITDTKGKGRTVVILSGGSYQEMKEIAHTILFEMAPGPFKELLDVS